MKCLLSRFPNISRWRITIFSSKTLKVVPFYSFFQAEQRLWGPHSEKMQAVAYRACQSCENRHLEDRDFLPQMDIKPYESWCRKKEWTFLINFQLSVFPMGSHSWNNSKFFEGHFFAFSETLIMRANSARNFKLISTKLYA